MTISYFYSIGQYVAATIYGGYIWVNDYYGLNDWSQAAVTAGLTISIDTY